MRRSRKAAPEEIEFWDALVAARSNGDVRIPTMAEVAAASKDPASAATANVAQATPEALGTSGMVPGADADGTPPRVDPGEFAENTFIRCSGGMHGCMHACMHDARPCSSSSSFSPFSSPSS